MLLGELWLLGSDKNLSAYGKLLLGYRYYPDCSVFQRAFSASACDFKRGLYKGVKTINFDYLENVPELLLSETLGNSLEFVPVLEYEKELVQKSFALFLGLFEAGQDNESHLEHIVADFGLPVVIQRQILDCLLSEPEVSEFLSFCHIDG